MKPLVSLDVFDTALFRKVFYPTDIFNVVEDKVSSKEIEKVIEDKAEDVNIETAMKTVREEIIENIKEDSKRALYLAKIIQEKIEYLIVNQQQYTKIAQSFDVSYRAVNNAFSMREKAEILITKVEAIISDIENICYMSENYTDKELNQMADDIYNVAEDIKEFLESKSKEEEFDRALLAYKSRDRRFGGVKNETENN